MPKQVMIKKVKLLEVLNKNLTLHKKVYAEAMEAFDKRYLKELTKMRKLASKGKYELRVNINKPENHADDYQTAIKMVEADCRDDIYLEFDEFTKYYLNKWDWIREFRVCYTSNVCGYSGSSGYAGTSGYSGYSGCSGYSVEAQSYFEGTDSE